MPHIKRYKGNPKADCNTIVLPQNLITDPGTLWEDFETVGDWTPYASSVAANTSEFKTGTQSVKMTSTSGGVADMYKTVAWDMSTGWQQLRYWLYLHNAVLTDYGNLWTELWSAKWSACYRHAFPTSARYVSGWNYITCPKSYFKVGAGSPNWASMIAIDFSGNAASGKVAVSSYDNLMVGVKAIPVVLLRFDDASTTQYSVAFPYMKAAGIRGTIYPITSLIGTAGYLTAAQLLEMQAAGWIVGNHTQNHTDLTTLTEAQQETEITAGKTDLDALGLTGGLYFNYPQGKWNADTVTAFTNLGLRTGQHTDWTHAHLTTTYKPVVLPNPYLYDIGCNPITSSTTLAVAEAWVDEAIAAGTILPLLFHAIDGPGMTTADFRALIDYIKAKKTAGLLYDITIDDYYNLTLGPVRVPRVR
jgi:peptidoglycan/xylan/chitin deacetylase (PgdA/CDA1 family)